jgi:hypothetical protein
MTEPAASIVSPLENRAESRFDRLVAKYRQDHQHPVNHVLHVWAGWPIMAAAVVLVPFRPLWSLGLFVTSYATMWAGHFLFERNLPTIFKNPSTPFVIAWAVIRDIGRGFARLVGAARRR